MFPFEFLLLVRAQAGGGDFAGLMAEQIELLRVSFLIHDQAGFFGLERGAAADETGEAFPQRIQVAESIEKGELFCGMEQGLMVVGSVNVHQPFAEGGERVRGGGGPVDELAVGAGRAEGAFEDELAAVTRLESILLEKPFEGRSQA